jgi:Oligosaccharyltransferase subunit Ribophorin II
VSAAEDNAFCATVDSPGSLSDRSMIMRRIVSCAVSIVAAASLVAAVPRAASSSTLRQSLTSRDTDSWARHAQQLIAAGPATEARAGISVLRDADNALQLLSALGRERHPGSTAKWCDAAAQGVYGAGGLKDVYHGFQVADALNCGTPTLSSSSREMVTKGLYGTRLEGLYYGVLASLKIGSPPTDVIKRVTVLVESSGLVASSDLPSSTPTVENAYMAAELLALLAERAPEGSADRTDALKALRAVAALLPKSTDAALADATLLGPLLSTAASSAALLNSSNTALLPSSTLQASAAQLLAARHCGSDVTAAARLYAALRAVAALEDAPPVAQLSPTTASAAVLSRGGVSLSVTTVLGKPVPGLDSVRLTALRRAATATSATSAGAGAGNKTDDSSSSSSNVLMQGLVLESSGAGSSLWGVKGVPEGISPGRYEAEVLL